ncbi:YMGG-like glycine zipper-containing protein [Hymenobacter sp. HDW8]|uniref:YMGG-like glycine zipper-containing protein n=1 Tax=Hymenobacter sp. HDW8 TaxID=2714932 RepID=UPI00140BA829|nr:YMGG-like glycine zipper-containing protein [Hymenobacter sp. HDW8]QIL77136.1 glycine zipper 2TM domain-containing protein [Hymenobacter sp. HDW8]
MKKLSYISTLILLISATFTNAVQAQEKKPWSPQAKGAVIGGVGGAAAGAIINKRNRPVGGVVGGVAGAGVGYAIGKRTDNKRKEAARVAAANRAAANRAAADRAERAALARRVEAAEKKAAVATAKPQQTQYPMMANGFAATTPMMLVGADGAPTASNAAYLPNESYGERNTPYPSSEVRRKSW